MRDQKRTWRLPLRAASVWAALILAASALTWAGPSAALAIEHETSVPSSGIRPMADLTKFRPGNIISNEVFFDSSTMNEARIDSFLRGKVPRCLTGYTCLKDYSETTTTRGADSYCAGYQGATSEPAARIILKVAQSCGINPQVLLVTLEKEQRLVTHTWPSEWRYTKAMGQGCPDTSECDTRFNGFFNQVYGAARQFRIYTEGRYFTYYAPGRTWNVRYSPNAACGSTPVYIENQATANLYYYTPYQPNAASLSAGYAEGDACSTYGNRNFYHFFTDWFGSTQHRVGALVQATGRPEVYLVSNGTKHRVQTYDDLLTLRSRLGGITAVGTRYTDELPTGPEVGRYVHDARSGNLFLLEPDGSKHRFASVEQISLFGYPFASYVNLEGRLLDAFGTGADVGAFVRAGSGANVYLLESGTRRHIYDGAAWVSVSRGTPGYIATMRADAAAAVPEGATVFAANSLVRGASSGQVLLATTAEPLLHIPSFALAAEFGATTYQVVPDAALQRSTIAQVSLTPVVTCEGNNYLAAGGSLVPLRGSDTGGLAVSTMSALQCAAWPKSIGALTAPLFVQPRGKGEVYLVEAGALRHVRSYSQLMTLNGTRPLSLIRWSPDTATGIGVGAPFLADGNIVQFVGASEVYQFSDGELHHIQTYATLVSLGGGKVPAIEALPAKLITNYVVGSPLA